MFTQPKQIAHFQAYLLVSQSESFLYVNKDRVNLGITLHLNSEPCNTECVKLVS